MKLGFAVCTLLLAQAQAVFADTPWRLEEAVELPKRLSLAVEHRTRYEYLDNQFRARRPGDDQIVALRTRVHARVRVTDWLRLGAEFQDSRAYLADGNTPVDTTLVNAAERSCCVRMSNSRGRGPSASRTRSSWDA